MLYLACYVAGLFTPIVFLVVLVKLDGWL